MDRFRGRGHLKLLYGGRFEKGDEVFVGVTGETATVVRADFSSPVFAGEISVRLDDGGFVLVAPEALGHRGRKSQDGARKASTRRRTPSPTQKRKGP